MCCLFTEDRRNRVLYTLSILVAIIETLLDSSGHNMRASAKERTTEAFRNSFGLPTDPFPTLLASTVSPFAFWYEDDPAGGCVRFPTERECERLMGLPEGWTKCGADSEEILSAHRYRALGNAIALPCAEYIMRGIYDVLTRRC